MSCGYEDRFAVVLIICLMLLIKFLFKPSTFSLKSNSPPWCVGAKRSHYSLWQSTIAKTPEFSLCGWPPENSRFELHSVLHIQDDRWKHQNAERKWYLHVTFCSYGNYKRAYIWDDCVIRLDLFTELEATPNISEPHSTLVSDTTIRPESSLVSKKSDI